MKKTNDSKHGFMHKVKRFFKHYFGWLVLALTCATLMTIVLFYGLG